MSYLSNIPSGEVSTTNLGGHLGIDHKTAAHYLQILNDVGLVRMVYPQEGSSTICLFGKGRHPLPLREISPAPLFRLSVLVLCQA
ncbi:MAG: hypothetical protein WB791_05080 [Waddliaceae bacterium]